MEIEEIEATPVVAEFNTNQIIAEAALRGAVYALAFTAVSSAAAYGIGWLSNRVAAKRAKKSEETPTLTVVQ